MKNENKNSTFTKPIKINKNKLIEEIDKNYFHSDSSEIVVHKILDFIIKQTFDKARANYLDKIVLSEFLSQKIIKLTSIFTNMSYITHDKDSEDLDSFIIPEINPPRIDSLAGNKTKIIKSSEKDFLNDYILNNEKIKLELNNFKPIVDKDVEKELKNREKDKKVGVDFRGKNSKLKKSDKINERLIKDLMTQLAPNNTIMKSNFSKTKTNFNEFFNSNNKTLEKTNFFQTKRDFGDDKNNSNANNTINKSNSNFQNKISTFMSNKFSNRKDRNPNSEEAFEYFPLEVIQSEEIKDSEDVLIREANLRIYFKEKERDRVKKNTEEKKMEKLTKEETKKKKDYFDELGKKPFCLDADGKIIMVNSLNNPESLMGLTVVESRVKNKFTNNHDNLDKKESELDRNSQKISIINNDSIENLKINNNLETNNSNKTKLDKNQNKEKEKKKNCSAKEKVSVDNNTNMNSSVNAKNKNSRVDSHSQSMEKFNKDKQNLKLKNKSNFSIIEDIEENSKDENNRTKSKSGDSKITDENSDENSSQKSNSNQSKKNLKNKSFEKSSKIKKEKKNKIKYYQPNPIRTYDIPPGVLMEIYGEKKEGGPFPSIPDKLTFKEFNDLLYFYKPKLKAKNLHKIKNENSKIKDYNMNNYNSNFNEIMDDEDFVMKNVSIKNKIGKQTKFQVEEDIKSNCSDLREKLIVYEEELRIKKNSTYNSVENPLININISPKMLKNKNNKSEINFKNKKNMVKVFNEFEYNNLEEIQSEKLYEVKNLKNDLNVSKNNEDFFNEKFKEKKYNNKNIVLPINKHVPFEKELGILKKYPRERLPNDILVISGKIKNTKIKKNKLGVTTPNLKNENLDKENKKKYLHS